MDKITIDTYDKMAVEYDRETANFWKRFPSTFLEKFKAGVLKRGTILDVGSGPGRDAAILSAAGFSVICLDASEAMLKITKEKGFESIRADFLELPFDKETFDGIWAYTSLLHVSKIKIPSALSEIYRVLKKTGVFALGLIVGLIEGKTEEYRESSGVGMPRLFSFYEKPEIENLLGEAGFKVKY
ncbi:MAG: class I SAM-dependent methyltransferase [Patescibacteria group bacterium]